MTLKCVKNDNGNNKCPASGIVFSKTAVLTYSERNSQIPIAYTPTGDIVQAPVHPRPLPDIERKVRMHLVLIGNKDTLVPEAIQALPFNIYQDEQGTSSTTSLNSSGAFTVEAGIQNFDKSSNAFLQPTSSQAPPPKQGNFGPLCVSTTETLPGTSAKELSIPSFLRPRSRSSSPTSGMRAPTLRTRTARLLQLSMEAYCQKRKYSKPRFLNRQVPRPLSPIPPKTPRPSKRKRDDHSSASAPKRPALARLDANTATQCPPLPGENPPTTSSTTSSSSTSNLSGTLPLSLPTTDTQTAPTKLCDTITLDATIVISDESSIDTSQEEASKSTSKEEAAKSSKESSSVTSTYEDTSNESGSKAEDYNQSSSSDPTPALPESPPPPEPSPAPSSLSTGSADNSEQVSFDTENALIANASLDNILTSAPIPEPEHVLICMETEDAQRNIVREATHILHFEHRHTSEAILRAFAAQSINIELQDRDEGIHVSLSTLNDTSFRTWRNTGPMPSPQSPSSTNATYGDSGPPSRAASQANYQVMSINDSLERLNQNPHISIERLALSTPSDPVSVTDVINLSSQETEATMEEDE